ncbi:hypothetical protein GALL_221470 [mine drainage metagenome]|uniref:Lipoprotein n=1 Tax=mine drainage metagenome TaxID=410659 RepID=A0A1J5S6G7_9ZZZZ
MIRPFRLAVSAALLLGLCACSSALWRTDSLSHESVDGQDVLVSWIWVGDDDIDISVAAEPPGEEPPFASDSRRLTPMVAQKAADMVAHRRCGDARQTMVMTTMPTGVYDYHYHCP